MSLLWAVGPMAVAVAAVVALVQLHAIAEAAVDLQGELRRFSEVQVAVAEVRSASAEARALRDAGPSQRDRQTTWALRDGASCATVCGGGVPGPLPPATR